jgi:CheY-like chemotaxis protein
MPPLERARNGRFPRGSEYKEDQQMSTPADKTILVVDDELDVREYFAEILTDAGFNVITAADGEEALDRVREGPPDFISLDLVMPRKSGIKFLYELRHNKDWSHIPVVIVTAHARDESGQKDFRDIFEGKSFSGPKFYLEKPVDEDTYLRMICENIGLEFGELDRKEAPEKNLDQVEDLIKDADPDTISEVLKLLKRRKS